MNRLLFLLLIVSLISSAEMLYAASIPVIETGGSSQSLWDERADSAQAALDKYFWIPLAYYYYPSSAGGSARNYWWQAHALDALVMGYRRTRIRLTQRG